MFQSLGEYIKAKEDHDKALAISMEISNRQEKEAQYGYLGNVFLHRDEYIKAKEYHENALAISIETGNRAREMESYGQLWGDIFRQLDENTEAAEYYKRASAIWSESAWKIVEDNTKQTITSAEEIFLIVPVNMAMQ